MDSNGFHSEYKFLALDDDDMTPYQFTMVGRNAVIDSYVLCPLSLSLFEESMETISKSC